MATDKIEQYLALRIRKGKLKYEDVVLECSKIKQGIDAQLAIKKEGER